MSRLVRKEDLIARVPGLTEARLERMIEIRIVAPVSGRETAAFAEPDIARLCLACEMVDTFDMEEDALAIVLSLTDQLHALRADLRTLMRAVEAQPQQTRADIGAAIRRLRDL